MKIGFFGDGPWAERALLPLAQDSRYTMVFVAVRASRPDQKLTEMAKSRGIPLLCPASVNSDESLAEIGKFGADLHVSMSYDQILREKIRSHQRLCGREDDVSRSVAFGRLEVPEPIAR